jgi:hypothetical protein
MIPACIQTWTKKTILQFYNVEWNIFDPRENYQELIMNHGTCFVHMKKRILNDCSSMLSSSEPDSIYQASPWEHSPSSLAPCAVPMRLSRIDQHIEDEPCARQRALLGVFSSRFSSVSRGVRRNTIFEVGYYLRKFTKTRARTPRGRHAPVFYRSTRE